MNNVLIRHIQNGSVVDTREVHNTWTEHGRSWLSRVISLNYVSPGGPLGDIYTDEQRIRSFGLGIGGKHASVTSYNLPLLHMYPPGYDPNATAGNAYDSRSPTGPFISTLERPVRVSGSSSAYPGDPADLWKYTDVSVYRQDNQSFKILVIVDATVGEIVYGPLSGAPISEAALYTDDVDVNDPYSPAITYVSFAPVHMTTSSIVHFSWTVRFG